MDSVNLTMPAKYVPGCKSNYDKVDTILLKMISGVILLGYGVWLKVHLYKFVKISPSFQPGVAFLLIGVGAFIVLISCLGCCCTVKSCQFFMYMYAAMLFVVIIIEISTGIMLNVYRDQIEPGFLAGLSEAVQKYDGNSAKESSALLDDLQKQLACCGIRNYTDWFLTGFSRKQTSPCVPLSCCSVSVKTCRNMYASRERGNFAASDIYTEGCLKVLVASVDGNVVDIRDIDIGICFFQIIGAILAFCLAKSFDRPKYEVIA